MDAGADTDTIGANHFGTSTLEPITLGAAHGFPDGSAIIGRFQDSGIHLATKGDLGNIYYQNPTGNSWPNAKGADTYIVEAETENLTSDLTDILGVEFGDARPDVGPIAYPVD